MVLIAIYTYIFITKQVIQYTDTCNYLGNTICSHDENVIIDTAINDMNMRLNHLLAEFSHCDSGTLSTLF